MSVAPALTDWITADKCKSGSNLYMHYITLATKTDDIFYFSFPSDEANRYIDIPPMFTKLLALFGSGSFPCNGLATSLIGVAWGIALYGFMLPSGATLRVMIVKPDGSTQTVNINQSSISNLIDRVIPIVAS